MTLQPSAKAAERGEPSYVWRAGQDRRLALIRQAAGPRVAGRVLENGCGVGAYLARLDREAAQAVGLEIELQRGEVARQLAAQVVCGAGEHLPFRSGWFDLILSHEVLEHVQDDRLAACEMARVLKPGGRLVVFVPNRGHPFETHGIYWRGRYHFGNIPLVNWLPRRWRDRLAPHVDVYTRRDLQNLFSGLSLRLVSSTVIFGAYDNVIARRPRLGKALRAVLQFLERTPLRTFGLSHLWVLEKV